MLINLQDKGSTKKLLLNRTIGTTRKLQKREQYMKRWLEREFFPFKKTIPDWRTHISPFKNFSAWTHCEEKPLCGRGLDVEIFLFLLKKTMQFSCRMGDLLNFSGTSEVSTVELHHLDNQFWGWIPNLPILGCFVISITSPPVFIWSNKPPKNGWPSVMIKKPIHKNMWEVKNHLQLPWSIIIQRGPESHFPLDLSPPAAMTSLFFSGLWALVVRHGVSFESLGMEWVARKNCEGFGLAFKKKGTFWWYAGIPSPFL